MMGAVVSTLLIAALLIISMVAGLVKRKAIVASAVSSIAGTDYSAPKDVNLAARIVLILSILTVATSPMLGLHLIATLGMAAGAGLLRLQLMRDVQRMTVASRGQRFWHTMASPQIAQAQLAFHFYAVDLPQPDHLSAWKVALDETGIPWFVIVRERHHLDAFRGNDSLAAIYVNSLKELVNCIPPKVCALLYANNAQKNRKMLAAFPKLTHVQLLHGDSDKPPSYSPLTKNFHRVFVAGQMAIDRYARHGVHIPEDRFRIIGRPQVQA